MLNLLFLGQNWAKIYISTLAHTHNIPDNPLTRNDIHLLHKELFVFNYWPLSADTILSVFSSFNPFPSNPSMDAKNSFQRISSVHFNCYWQQKYTIILWSRLMQRRILVF